MLQFFQLIQLLAFKLIHLIQPVLVPLCFVVAWGLVVMTVWNLVAATRDGVKRAQVMHQIPCSECRYFTNNYLLKCPLHPKIALSEEAINCGDYETDGLFE
jgi:hypothetical protein